MINNDILIKYSIKTGYGGYEDWVSHVKVLSSQIKDIRDNDFTGIGLGDLSLRTPEEIRPGMRIILCDYLDQNGGDPENASILGLVLRISPDDPMIIEVEIEGIGGRSDFHRDPGRLLRWGKLIYPDLRRYPCLLEMTTKPRSDGGAVYYYYNKSARDSRVNYLPGHPKESKEAIMGTLRNVANEDLQGVRGRAQYMHIYRRVYREINSLLPETPWDKDLQRLQRIFREEGKANHQNSKKLSSRIWESVKN